ncbi:MAG: hypothetical protein AAFY28_14165 [Actinomycetota bacterium]
MTTRAQTVPIVAIVIALSAAACGGSGDSSSETTTALEPAASATPTASSDPAPDASASDSAAASTAPAATTAASGAGDPVDEFVPVDSSSAPGFPSDFWVPASLVIEQAGECDCPGGWTYEIVGWSPLESPDQSLRVIRRTYLDWFRANGWSDALLGDTWEVERGSELVQVTAIPTIAAAQEFTDFDIPDDANTLVTIRHRSEP